MTPQKLGAGYFITKPKKCVTHHFSFRVINVGEVFECPVCGRKRKLKSLGPYKDGWRRGHWKKVKRDAVH